MTILTTVGDQRWRPPDLAAHMLWSPRVCPITTTPCSGVN